MDMQKARTVRLKTLDLSRARHDIDSIAKGMEVADIEGVKKYLDEHLSHAGIGVGKEGVITVVCSDHLVKVQFLGNASQVFVPAVLLEVTGRAIGQRFSLHHKLGVHGVTGAFAPVGSHVEFTGATIEDMGGGVVGIMNSFRILDGEYKGQDLRFAPGSSAEWSLKEG
jgi:hypothetical protein